MLVSVLLTIVGSARLLSQDRASREPSEMDSRILLASIAIVPLLLLPMTQLSGQLLPTGGFIPGAMVLALMFFVVALRLWGGVALPWNRYLAPPMLVGLILLTAATQSEYGGRSRYSLLVQSPALRDEQALFAFVRKTTPLGAQFLVPPELGFFRLRAQRPIVVDFKAMPINRTGLIEWYSRLEAISGEHHPVDFGSVYRGYRTIDAARLEKLRRAYHLTHVVLPPGHQLLPEGWDEVYRNRTFSVLAYRALR
jgi:hypothetical protein